MKEPILTINDDYYSFEIKGCKCKVLAYDRDKRFLVELLDGKDVGECVWLKPHWFDDIHKHYGSYQHMALYKLPSNIENPENKKERFSYYKSCTRKRYNNSSRCNLSIKVGDVWYDNLSRKQLITKLRFALQTNQDVYSIVHVYKKWGSASGCVIEISVDENEYCVDYANFKEVARKIRGFQRKLAKLIDSY